jgi:hypothetical protein
MSFSHISLQKKGRHYYTAREKIFFTKIELHRQQLNEKRNMFKQLEQTEEQIQ